MESLLPAIVQAIIGGVFAILAVYAGHLLKRRRTGPSSITAETENVVERLAAFQSTPAVTTWEPVPLYRRLGEVAIAILLVACVNAVCLEFSPASPDYLRVILYALCFFGSFVLVSIFKEPRWLPMLAAIPICSFVEYIAKHCCPAILLRA
jgi:hypothetical protein